MLHPGLLRRFRPETLFQPRSVLLVGAETPLGRAVAANLGDYPGGRCSAADIAGQTAADLAVLACDAADVPGVLPMLERAGIYAAACLTEGADLAAAGAVRVLGPASFGIIAPAQGLNASTAHLSPRPGKVALVSQSAALCRAVLDWAEPNGVGFSHVVGIGGGVRMGFAAVLDYLSRDPATGAILLDIRTVRDRRAFLAAARAAARLRPVLALRAGDSLRDPSGRADAVFDAALRRAGVLRVSGFDALLDAAEIVTRVRPPRAEPLVVVTNAVGPAHLAADAARGADIPLLRLDHAARAAVQLMLPDGPSDPGIVWTGADGGPRLADVCARLGTLPEVGGIVALLAPGGVSDDGAAAEALGAVRTGCPLLACVPGQTTAGPLRHRLAAAGMAVFETPEAAVRAYATLVRQRRTRAAAAELPARRILDVAPDGAAVAAILAVVRREGREALTQDEALAVLAAYGIATVPGQVALSATEAVRAAARLGFPVVLKRRRLVSGGGALALDLADVLAVRTAAERIGPGPLGFLVQQRAGRARELRIGMADDPLFGPAIAFGLGGAAAALAQDGYELPPLNLALARGLVGRSRAGRLLAAQTDMADIDLDAVADALVRVSQLVQDHPEIAALSIDPLFAGSEGVRAIDASLTLRPPGIVAEFAISAYPAEWAQTFDAKGDALLLRPIRPEDAEAHAALFARLTPEDVRFRFFNLIRQLSPEQIARMTQVDYEREMAFVAVRLATTETVGVARLVREPGTGSGEFAVVVEPSAKGRGVARALMRRITEWGASQGMERVVGQVLAENAPMLGFMRRLGAELHRMPEEPEVMEATISLAGAPP